MTDDTGVPTTATHPDRADPGPADPALAALATAAGRTAQLLRRIPDPGARVPGLTWTVAEVAAHLVADLRVYTDLVAGRAGGQPLGSGTAAELNAAENRRQLAAFPERDLGRLAAELTDTVPAYLAAAAAAPRAERVSTPIGIGMTPATVTAILLGEQLVHGLDLARGAGLSWPIGAADARLVIPGLMALLPSYLDRDRARGLHIRYELRLGGALRYHLAVVDGTGTVSAATGRADCVITADPVAFLLVGYGRTGQWGPILRGKLRAGGRKPWLGFRFAALTVNP